MSREIMQEALDALEFPHDSEWSNKAKAIEALQHALTQPEQEPNFCKDCGKGLLGKEHIHTCSPQVKRQWVGLTLNDITGHMCDCGDDGTYQTSCFIDYAKAIEQKLKELNT